MQFSADEWQKMQLVYEEQWAQTHSPIHVIRELRAKFKFGLADAKYVFDKLHFRENYQQRQEEIEKMVEIATRVFSDENEVSETTDSRHSVTDAAPSPSEGRASGRGLG